MAKLPWMKFWPDAYLSDTRSLTPSSKGIWMDLICYLWKAPERGRLTETITGFSRMVGASEEDVKTAFKEFMSRSVCSVVTNGHGLVTVMSRRITREEKERESARLRKERQREKENVTPQSRQCHRERIEDRSKKIEERIKESNSGTSFEPPETDYEPPPETLKPTTEEKKELSKLCVQVNQKCGGRFNSFAWIQSNLSLNPQTHIHVLRRLLETKEIKSPWALANEIASIENGNYNEKDAIKKHNEIKKSTPTIGEILKGSLNG